MNSIENFARSWQRAAGFFEVTPVSQPFLVSRGADEESQASRHVDVERGESSKSLLHAHFAPEESGNDVEGSVIETDDGREARGEAAAGKADDHVSSARDDLLGVAPHLTSQYGASYGTSYGSLTSRVNEQSIEYAGQLWREHLEQSTQEPDKEREPLLVRRVEREDGKVVNVVVGQSTLPQTIFNSVNVLIGVGLLSLPLAFRHAGWLVGLTFLVLSAIVTSYTARILAKCLDVDDTLITFADVAYISFGPKARIITSVLFGLELIAANVALVVLFADSLHALVPGWGPVEWKIVCAVVLMPLAFLPLRVLSFSSVLGIVSCFGSKSASSCG